MLLLTGYRTATFAFIPLFEHVIGLFVIPVARVSSGLLALLMLAAIAAHIKVGDPLIKAMPALFMAAMCTFVFLTYSS